VFYGWWVVAGAFVSHLLSYGVLTVAFGVFFPYMADALHLGRGLLASAAAVARLVSAAGSPLIGPIVDRRGPRPIMALGVLSLAGGAVLLARAGGGWHVMLGYGVVMAFGSIALGDLTGDATVARWFVRRRGRALAFATMGLSSAGIVIPLPVAFLIDRFGWRAAWVMLAATVLGLGLAATVLMRRSPEAYGLAPDGRARAPRGDATRETPLIERSLGARAAARTPAFWLLILSTNLAGLGFFGVNLHLFSYVTDLRFSATIAAAVVTYLYTLHTVAKPLWGLIAERVHVRYCIAACYAGGGLGVLLLGGGSMAWLLAFATVYGLTRGAQSFVTSLAWADYFGRDAQGAIRGLAAPFRHLSAAAGPIVGGVLYDATGDYRLAFAIFAAAFFAGAGVALAAKPPR
jgi:MFS family permease